MRVIVYMQIAHVSPTCTDTHARECVQTCRLLLIGQRPVGVQTGRPHAGDTSHLWATWDAQLSLSRKWTFPSSSVERYFITCLYFVEWSHLCVQALLFCYLQGQIYGTFVENQYPVLIKELNRKDAFTLTFELHQEFKFTCPLISCAF